MSQQSISQFYDHTLSITLLNQKSSLSKETWTVTNQSLLSSVTSRRPFKDHLPSKLYWFHKQDFTLLLSFKTYYHILAEHLKILHFIIAFHSDHDQLIDTIRMSNMYTLGIFCWSYQIRSVQTTSTNVYHLQHAGTSNSWAYIGEAKEEEREEKCTLTSSNHVWQTQTTWLELS